MGGAIRLTISGKIFTDTGQRLGYSCARVPADPKMSMITPTHMKRAAALDPQFTRDRGQRQLESSKRLRSATETIRAAWNYIK